MEYPSFIIIDDGKFDPKEFEQNCAQHFEKYEILFATNRTFDGLSSTRVFETKETNADKIINALIPKIDGDKLILIREYTGNFNDIILLVNAVKKENQIAKIKEKHSRFADFFKRLLDMVINFIFGYKLFHTQLSMLCFGKVPLDVLKTLENASMYTKINKWAGIDIVEVNISHRCKLKFKPKIKGNIISLCVFSVLFIAPILCWALIDYSKKAFYLRALYVLIMAISLTIVAISVILICVKNLVGDNEYEKAEIKEKEKVWKK